MHGGNAGLGAAVLVLPVTLTEDAALTELLNTPEEALIRDQLMEDSRGRPEVSLHTPPESHTHVGGEPERSYGGSLQRHQLLTHTRTHTHSGRS